MSDVIPTVPFLQISDRRGQRRVDLTETRYTVGNIDACTIQIFSATALGYVTILLQRNRCYQALDVDVYNPDQGVLRECETYTLAHNDRICFAPDAEAIYQDPAEPCEQTVQRSSSPSDFPPATAEAPTSMHQQRSAAMRDQYFSRVIPTNPP